MSSKDVDCGRLAQIFSAKLVLEVFGGAGAIWGFSEASTLRNPETNEFWRTNALSIGLIFFIRFLLQVRDYVTQRDPDEGRDMWIRLTQIFAAKLVLEVFGGAGAIWGFSEVCTLRNPETQEQWRFNALCIGGVFGIRFLLQIKDFVMKIYGHVSHLDEDRSLLRLVQIFSAKIVLEVFGAGGAIWGFSESLTLRNPETQEFWRFWAALTGFVFFIRFILQIIDHTREKKASIHDKVGMQVGTGATETTSLVV